MTATENLLARILQPTRMGSAEISRLAAGVRARALFSARTTEARHLSTLRRVLADMASGKGNAADARLALLRSLQSIGYDPERGGFPGQTDGIPPAPWGSLRDLSSTPRLKLQLDTNLRQARSVAQSVAGSTPVALALEPGWTLGRVFGRAQPRGDWPARWAAARDATGGVGSAEREFTALKDSPVWQALGDGAGGYEDTLGQPYPPFAFGSGIAWRPADRATCERLALLSPGEVATAPDGTASLAPADAELDAAFADMPANWRESALAGVRAGASIQSNREVAA
jgi:hypothetical protein